MKSRPPKITTLTSTLDSTVSHNLYEFFTPRSAANTNQLNHDAKHQSEHELHCLHLQLLITKIKTLNQTLSPTDRHEIYQDLVYPHLQTRLHTLERTAYQELRTFDCHTAPVAISRSLLARSAMGCLTGLGITAFLAQASVYVGLRSSNPEFQNMLSDFLTQYFFSIANAAMLIGTASGGAIGSVEGIQAQQAARQVLLNRYQQLSELTLAFHTLESLAIILKKDPGMILGKLELNAHHEAKHIP